MHLLTFAVGDGEYAIESRHVVEVLPMVAARPLPHSPAFLRGVFLHRGRLVPLVDLGLRLAGAAVRERLSTRVIVVEFPSAPCAGGSAGGPRRLGLGAEKVVSLAVHAAPESVLSLGGAAAPWLGPLLRVDGRTVQLLRVEHILPSEAAAAVPDSTAADRDVAAPADARPS
jgi:chemotaxis-related protein WspB